METIKKTYKKSDGALWVRNDKNGKEYFSGEIDVDGRIIKFMAFSNNFKQDGENTPDFKISINNPSPPNRENLKKFESRGNVSVKSESNKQIEAAEEDDFNSSPF